MKYLCFAYQKVLDNEKDQSYLLSHRGFVSWLIDAWWTQILEHANERLSLQKKVNAKNVDCSMITYSVCMEKIEAHYLEE